MYLLNRMELSIQTAKSDDAEEVSNLVLRSFAEFASPHWEPEACQWFQKMNCASELVGKIHNAAHSSIALVNNAIVGFLLMPKPTLLGMLFIHPNEIRNGVGNAMWIHTCKALRSEFPTVSTVELNATPNAISFYTDIGFIPVSDMCLQNGCRVMRMSCRLPVKDIEAECNLTSA